MTIAGPVDTALLVVQEAASVVQIFDSTVLVVDSPAPLQLVEVLSPTPVAELVVVQEEVVTLLTVAEQGPPGPPAALGEFAPDLVAYYILAKN